MPVKGLEYIDAAIEWVKLIGSLILGVIAMIWTSLRNDNSKAHKRIDALQEDNCTKKDLEAGLKPIHDTQQLILNNMLEHRKTELVGADPVAEGEHRDPSTGSG